MEFYAQILRQRGLVCDNQPREFCCAHHRRHPLWFVLGILRPSATLRYAETRFRFILLDDGVRSTRARSRQGESDGEADGVG